MKYDDDAILFYSSRGEYGAFSNFSRHAVRYKNRIWKTSEHAYQADKFDAPDVKNKIFHANTPGIAADIGRDRKNPLRKDWESVKVQIMYDVIKAKFTQHDHLKELLLSTGDRLIVEHTVNDTFWADGGDGKGKNMLGKLLMRLRDELRTK